MSNIRVPHTVAQESVTINSLNPELQSVICSLQIENVRMKYLLREIDGKEACRLLTGIAMPQLEIANLIGEWETNREKFIGEIVAHVFKQLYGGKRST